VAVHHVDVQQVGVRLDGRDVICEVSEVGGEDGRSELVREVQGCLLRRF
jgi:hypothetical protein